MTDSDCDRTDEEFDKAFEQAAVEVSKENVPEPQDEDEMDLEQYEEWHHKRYGYC